MNSTILPRNNLVGTEANTRCLLSMPIQRASYSGLVRGNESYYTKSSSRQGGSEVQVGAGKGVEVMESDSSQAREQVTHTAGTGEAIHSPHPANGLPTYFTPSTVTQSNHHNHSLPEEGNTNMAELLRKRRAEDELPAHNINRPAKILKPSDNLGSEATMASNGNLSVLRDFQFILRTRVLPTHGDYPGLDPSLFEEAALHDKFWSYLGLHDRLSVKYLEQHATGQNRATTKHLCIVTLTGGHTFRHSADGEGMSKVTKLDPNVCHY